MTTATTTKAPAKLARPAKKVPAAKKVAAGTPAKGPKATTTNGAPAHPQFDKFMEQVLANPEARAAFEDANARENLIQALTTRRIEMGISQGEAAKRAGIGQAQVSQAEAGKALPVHVLLKLSRALGGKLEIRFTR